MGRSFGIAATPDRDAVHRIAAQVEQLGYSALWTNDTPMADGLSTAEQIGDATATLRIGIGVIAVDRRPIMQWAKRLSSLPVDRLTIGVGSGFSDRPTQTVKKAVKELRDFEPKLRIAVAAMGPLMVSTAGEVADLVLLNWMTPIRIDWAKQRLEGSKTLVGAYVRAATGPGGRELIAAEAGRYISLPHYRRHFEAMGADPSEVGVVLGENQLDLYEQRLDETVIRGVTMDPDDVDGILRLVRQAAPVRS